MQVSIRPCWNIAAMTDKIVSLNDPIELERMLGWFEKAVKEGKPGAVDFHRKHIIRWSKQSVIAAQANQVGLDHALLSIEDKHKALKLMGERQSELKEQVRQTRRG